MDPLNSSNLDQQSGKVGQDFPYFYLDYLQFLTDASVYKHETATATTIFTFTKAHCMVKHEAIQAAKL
jgi:hypothetical protein